MTYDNRFSGALFSAGDMLRGPFMLGDGVTKHVALLNPRDCILSVASEAGTLLAAAKIKGLPTEEGRPTKGEMILADGKTRVRIVCFVSQHSEHGLMYQLKPDKYAELEHPKSTAALLAKL